MTTDAIPSFCVEFLFYYLVVFLIGGYFRLRAKLKHQTFNAVLGQETQPYFMEYNIIYVANFSAENVLLSSKHSL